MSFDAHDGQRNITAKRLGSSLVAEEVSADVFDWHARSSVVGSK